MNWIDKTFKLGIKEFNTVANTVNYNLDNILTFLLIEIRMQMQNLLMQRLSYSELT